MINKDLKHNYKINQISSNIKSHSFRINIIAKLLKNTSVQNTANIIGHRDIKSTMAYKRYALNKKKIQELLNKTLLKQDFIYYFYSLKDVFCQLEFYHFKF
jgi:site-specific recombinase XerD